MIKIKILIDPLDEKNFRHKLKEFRDLKFIEWMDETENYKTCSLQGNIQTMMNFLNALGYFSVSAKVLNYTITPY
jgi:hypothetical protein